MPRRKPSSVRLSEECEVLLAGIGTNQSAAIRALLLIGAGSIGLDLAAVEADLRTALSADLPEALYLRLYDLAEQVRLGSGAGSCPEPNGLPAYRASPPRVDAQRGEGRPHSEAAPDHGADVDPLASVGFDFG